MPRIASIAIAASLAILAAPSVSSAQAGLEGLSLDQTLDLIRNALVAQGAVVWQGFVHDSNNGQDWNYQRRIDISNFTYDIPGCTFNFHYRVTTNGSVSSEVDGGVPLRDARVIKVAPEAQFVAQRDAQGGHPTWSSRLQPDIWDVDVIRVNGTENNFSFYDQESARRVGRYFEHAAGLCGVSHVDTF